MTVGTPRPLRVVRQIPERRWTFGDPEFLQRLSTGGLRGMLIRFDVAAGR